MSISKWQRCRRADDVFMQSRCLVTHPFIVDKAAVTARMTVPGDQSLQMARGRAGAFKKPHVRMDGFDRYQAGIV